MARKKPFEIKELAQVKVSLASPELIREWSHGEVTRAETINYRSQKPEPKGLFCEVIFGPSKDYECHCGKYKKIRYKGTVCEKCGVEVIAKYVRRERMGHIELASPCTHIWYLKGQRSIIGTLLDMSSRNLESIVYFKSHVVLDVGTSKILQYKQTLDESNSRDVFIQVIKEEIQPLLEPGKYEYAKSESRLNELADENRAFDFFTMANFISQYTGAVFGEGAEAVKQLLKDVDLDKEFELVNEEMKSSTTSSARKNLGFTQKQKKLIKRLEVIQAFRNADHKPEWMVLDVIPVTPPDLRPMIQLDGGRFATSDINDLYRRIISRNNRHKDLRAMQAPKVIMINGQRMLQEAVDSLIDNDSRRPVMGSNRRPLKSLTDALKGKQGRFRQNLLGKRVDYSGRSVIAVGPELKMYQCGIPREMAIKLFRPFIAHDLIERGFASNHTMADRIIDRYDEVVYDIIEEIIGSHPVLLNRAPTLHRLGIQAFQPVLVSGSAIRLHPLVCAGFNADFDGDQMAVHVPLSKEAQEEALNLMLASNNILGPKDGKPIATPSQDIIIGNYYLTLESSKEDYLKAATECEKIGDIEGAKKNELYAESEGKVFADVDEIKRAYATGQIHLHNRIAIRGKSLSKENFTSSMNESYLITTVGKILFNEIFPYDFPFINEPSKENLEKDQISFFVPKGTDIRTYIQNLPLRKPINKKYLEDIVNEIFKRYGTSKTSAVLDKIKDIGFHYSTVQGLTISLADITPVHGKEEIIEEGDKTVRKINKAYEIGLYNEDERYENVIKTWKDVTQKVEDELIEQFSKETRNPLFIMFDSGARGKKSNFLQLKGMRGVMAAPARGGKIKEIEIPVKSNFREGITVSEFFIASHGSRKGGADTAIKTADSGYLTRRLVDIAQDVIVTEQDCGSEYGFVVTAIYERGMKNINKPPIVPLADRIEGRFTIRDVVDPTTGVVLCPANTMVTEEVAKRIEAAGVQEVEIRSVFGCQSEQGICAHCYGKNLATGRLVEVGDAVGIMAAQSIGEPGTQLTMRTFHTGGVAGAEDVTQGLPRVQELFEVYDPNRDTRNNDVISKISGTVTNIEEIDNSYAVTVSNELEEITHNTLHGQRLRVAVGDKVKYGEPLCDGSINPRDLLRISNVTAVQNYILNEVQKVYRISASVKISDKHLEVIVRQMLKRVVIIDSGDTDLLPGKKLTKTEFTKINEEYLLKGLRPAVAKPVIHGISSGALNSDSFLSAASFIHTRRILTDATIKAKTDNLVGLKENVITGKLIPAGRGILTEEQEKELLDNFSVEEKMEQTRQLYIEESKVGK
ncbi:MAG: DNA-directed RNA polymerase subunit beta' [Bacilli bacterium]|jgi:DNA-directed RNA polymerase subunit beta'